MPFVKQIMLTATSGAGFALLATAVEAGKKSKQKVSQVPEIDAASGLLALAAVLAVVVLVWERRRRMNAKKV